MSETVRQKSRGAAIAAVAMERLFEPRLGGGVTPRPRFLAFVLVCLLLHLAILGFLLWEDQKADFAPPPEENAVEVITEPPPPPPPPPQEEKKEEPPPPEEKKQEQQKPPPPPPPPPEMEKPATDAPKLESKAKSELDSPEEQKEAKTPRNEKPTEKLAPKDEKPEALKDAKEEEGEDKDKPSPMKAIEDKPDAEVIERAEKTPTEAPDAKDTKAAKKGQGLTIAEMVAAMAPLPDYKLAAPPKTSPVGGGQAKTTYLTILYGLIMPHMRIPPRVRDIQMSSKGVVAFYIDEMGNLTHQAVYKTSGLPDLDAAALAAVRAAAPFPAPPRGLPHAMLFSYATK
jgi:periplasmic protein TonB